MKKVLALLLVGCLSIMPISVGAETIGETYEVCEEYAVESCIEEFFYSFENMNKNAGVGEMMVDIADVSASGKVQEYEMDRAAGRKVMSAQTENNATFLEMVELLIQRREIIEKTADVDLTEYQKTLDITMEDAIIEENTADVNVKVLKKWHYAFSPEVESAAEDGFKISLIKEGEEWKISNISGLANIIMDERLVELGDEITCLEREKYINEIAKERALDLEDLNLFEGKTDKEIGQYITVSDIGSVTRATSGYNNTAAVLYAQKYAITPNSSYTTFAMDCTNFSSQCLNAGGIKQHVGTAFYGNCWFYKSSENRSSSWAGASEFQEYVTSSVSKINISLSDFNSVVPGDMIQLTSSGSAYHSLIVTGFVQGANGRNDLLVCAHTSNRLNASLAQYYSSSSKVYYHIKGSK